LRRTRRGAPPTNALDDDPLTDRRRKLRQRLGIGFDPLPPYVEWELAWYDKAARGANAGYLTSECIALFAALLVPVATAASWGSGAVALLGASAAAGSGVGLIFRFKANYIARNTALEQIRATVGRYLAAPPERRDPARLVREVSRFVLAETSDWQQAMVMADGSGPVHNDED
jgi:hypothetical protein